MVLSKLISFINEPFKYNQKPVKEDEISNPNSSTNHCYFINKGEVNEIKRLLKTYSEL